MKHTAIRIIIIILLIVSTAACNQVANFGSVPTMTIAATIALPKTTRTTASLPNAAHTMAAPLPVVKPTEPDSSAPVWVTNPADRTVLRIDPASNSIAAAIPIEGRPDIAAAGEGAVWVLDREHNLVFRIDPARNRVVSSIPLPAGQAEALAVGAGGVWVGMTGRINLLEQSPGQEEELIPPGMVVQIDPNNNQIREEFPVQPVSQLFVNGSMLWILSRSVIDTPLQVFDLRSKQGMAVPLQNAPPWLPTDAAAVDPENLWLFSAAHSKIFRASLDGRVNAEVRLAERQPTGYADLLPTTSGLWAATPWGTVLHIDPSANHVIAAVDLNVPLTKLIPGGRTVWALSQQTGQLFRIDSAQNAVVATIATGSKLQPTVVPSPTPRVVIWKPCPDAPTSRLKVGDLAYVTKDPPLPNRVRKEPNHDAEILGLINPGGSMEILEGPTCANGWVWWHVKNADLNGWTPEGDKETYWLIPLFK